MQNIRIYILMLMLPMTIWASGQSLTSSPYSAFGVGELNDNVPNTYRAMGGVGIGMRTNKVINPMQPASYTGMDSLTFMFDVAASVSWSNYEDANGRKNKANGNVEYITMQFPIWKKHIAMSLGVLPYSARSYNFSLVDSTRTYPYRVTYFGSGAISEVYGGLSFNLWDWVAVGANCYYMFSNDFYGARFLNFSNAALTSTEEHTYFSVSTVRYRLGAQFFHTFGDHRIVLGGIFEQQLPIRNQYYVYETYREWTAVEDGKSAFDMPMVYGVGFSYTWKNRLTMAGDFKHEMWGKCRYDDQLGKYKDRMRAALGVEYLNDPMGRRYVDRVMWRLGANVGQSYLPQVMGPEFGISLGFGLPLRTSGTVFNTSVEYTHRGRNGMLQDNTLKLTINAAICENWFFKRKI